MVAREEAQAGLAGLRIVSASAGGANVGTTPVRDGFGFDEASLARWLRDHVDGFSGPLTVEQFKGGQSNPTYKLLTPAANYVLRRKPSGTLLPGAHDVEREARITAALHATGVSGGRRACRVHGRDGHRFSILRDANDRGTHLLGCLFPPRSGAGSVPPITMP